MSTDNQSPSEDDATMAGDFSLADMQQDDSDATVSPDMEADTVNQPADDEEDDRTMMGDTNFGETMDAPPAANVAATIDSDAGTAKTIDQPGDMAKTVDHPTGKKKSKFGSLFKTKTKDSTVGGTQGGGGGSGTTGPAVAAPDNKYDLNKELARGGMGKIWLCKDVTLRREVAYKELLPRAMRRASVVERFIQEAQITGQLEHPGIVPIYDLGYQDNGTPFYSMKLVRGVEMKDRIVEYHKMEDGPEKKKAFISLLRCFIQVCNALAFAHERGVLHRDLKPQNVMLGDYGETLVLDWSVAKLYDPAKGRVGKEITVDGEMNDKFGVEMEAESEAEDKTAELPTTDATASEQMAATVDQPSPAMDATIDQTPAAIARTIDAPSKGSDDLDVTIDSRGNDDGDDDEDDATVAGEMTFDQIAGSDDATIDSSGNANEDDEDDATVAGEMTFDQIAGNVESNTEVYTPPVQDAGELDVTIDSAGNVNEEDEDDATVAGEMTFDQIAAGDDATIDSEGNANEEDEDDATVAGEMTFDQIAAGNDVTIDSEGNVNEEDEEDATVAGEMTFDQIAGSDDATIDSDGNANEDEEDATVAGEMTFDQIANNAQTIDQVVSKGNDSNQDERMAQTIAHDAGSKSKKSSLKATMFKKAKTVAPAAASKSDDTVAHTLGGGPGYSVGGAVTTDPRSEGAITKFGSVLGTPAYMPAEQAKGLLDDMDARTDIYSLGAILYDILTNKAPIKRGKMKELLERVVNGEIDPPRTLVPETPKPLEAICMKALSLEMDDRYDTAILLADDIDAYLADEAVSAYDEPWNERAARWVRHHPTQVWTTVAVVLVLMLGWFGWTTVEANRIAGIESSVQGKVAEARTAADGEDFDKARTLLSEAQALVKAEESLMALNQGVEAQLVDLDKLVAAAEDRRIAEARRDMEQKLQLATQAIEA